MRSKQNTKLIESFLRDVIHGLVVAALNAGVPPKVVIRLADEACQAAIREHTATKLS
jgi:hypothetical protein